MDGEVDFVKAVPYKEKDSCAIIALSLVLGKSYDDVRSDLEDGFQDFDAIKSYLSQKGFHEVNLPLKFCEKRMTVRKLAEISLGLDLICFCGDHMVAIKDRKYYDLSDSGNICVFSYFVKSR